MSDRGCTPMPDDPPRLTELLNGRLKLLVLIDILDGNMLLLSSLGA